MNKYLRIWVCAIIMAWSLALSASAADVVGSTDDPMMVGGGARPLGMGRAYTAVVDDADAMFINPGGLANMKGPQAMSMFTNLLGDVYYTEFSGAIPFPFGTVGAGYISTGVNNIPTTGGLDADYYDSMLVLSYATPLGRYFSYYNNVFVGVNAKFYSRGFSGSINQYATGTSADVGVKYIFDQHTSIGICRQNFLPVSFGGKLDINTDSGTVTESIAGMTKVGVVHRPEAFDQNLLLCLDADLPAYSGRPVTLHAGTEWKMSKFFAIRGGLDQSIDPGNAEQTIVNPTYGVSFGYSGFRVDYAYHPYYNDPSLATTYVSLSYQSEPWFAMKGTVE